MVGLALNHAAQDQNLALAQLSISGISGINGEEYPSSTVANRVGEEGKVKGQWSTEVIGSSGDCRE